MDIAATGGAGPSPVTTGYVADNGGEGFAAALGAGTTELSVSGDAKAAASNGSVPASATELPAVGMNLPLLANATTAQAFPEERTADETALPPVAAAGADQPIADAIAAAVAEPATATDCINQVEVDLPTAKEAQAVPPDPATPAASTPATTVEDKKPGKSAEQNPVEPAVLELPRENGAVALSVGATHHATHEDTDSSEASIADPETSGAGDAAPVDGSPASAANASWTQLPAAAQPVQTKTSKVVISGSKEPALRGTQAAGQLSAEGGRGTTKPVKGTPLPAAGQFAGMMPGAGHEQPPQANGAPAQPATFLTTGQQIGGASQPVADGLASAAANHVAMAFRPDKIAREMGLEVARRVSAGGDELLIRLDPAELGRINIRMSVNEQGHLRAVVAAEAPAVLDAIRGDVSELNRALEQAGVRTDSQSFRFDRGGGGDQSGQWQQRYQKQNAGTDQGQTSSFAGNDDQPAYRSMATTGRVNMMA